MSIRIEVYRSDHLKDVVDLWSLCFPDEPDWNESRSLISQKLTVQPELFLVAKMENRVVGTAIGGYDGVRGWVHKVASHPEFRNEGIAKSLMTAVEDALKKLGCTKLNLQVRAANVSAVSFYESIGYGHEDRVSMSKQLNDSVT